MRPTSAFIASMLLVLTAIVTACGEDADTEDTTLPPGTDTPVVTEPPTDGTLTPGPATATASPGTTETPTPTATPEGSDTPTGINLTQTCEADRYTVDYPDGWYANSGEVATDACGWFSPEPFEVEPATELLTEVFMYIDPVAYEDVLESPGIEEASERSETTVDGFMATRLERPSDGPSIPPGTIATQYFVELGNGETLIATTYDLEDFDYETNREVLDAMIETLSFTSE